MSLGIYIHIPFCVSKCKYCDFLSHSSTEDEREAYVKALCKEIEDFEASDNVVDTIYFGGGTPTVLKAEQLAEILSLVKKKFSVDKNCEITTECNPATMNKEGFKILKEAGFNRLSIGLQSANDEELKLLGRIHRAEDCVRCVEDAKSAGFENISLDLMFGLPYQTMEKWKHSLEAVTKLSPKHISCYGLKIEEGTPFYSMNYEIDEDLSRDMYDYGVSYLKENGYELYEISNFAKEGYESRHNLKYWQCDDFAGFGVGAYSCVNGVRYSNTRSMDEYLSKADKIAERIKLIDFDAMSEYVFLGLRTRNGISEVEFQKRFGRDIYEVFGEELKKNIKRGTISKIKDRFIIPKEYLYVSNGILVDFV